jgi:hypothetical protein
MQEIEYIAMNIANNLSSSRIASFMIENKRFDENYFQTEILNSTLMFNNPGLIENTHVYFNENNGNKRYIEFLILNENPILELDKLNNEFIGDTSYFIFLIKENLKSSDLERIEKKINTKFETKFNYKSFKLLNGRFCILFYSQSESHIVVPQKTNKRNKVSLPRGTYLNTLKKIKHWLEDYGEITFYDLMEKFEDEIKNELLKLNDSEIDIDNELKIFRQDSGTGAKRSQILLHTVNEKNRLHFRSSITTEYDSFYYVDYNENDINVNNRKLSAFNPHDYKLNEIEVYYEKGKDSIKVKDFKNRY